VVIPHDARKRLGIHQGDKVLVVIHPAGNALVLFKVEAVRDILASMIRGLSRIEQDLAAMPESETAEER